MFEWLSEFVVQPIGFDMFQAHQIQLVYRLYSSLLMVYLKFKKKKKKNLNCKCVNICEGNYLNCST